MSTVKAANLQNTGSGAPAFQNSSGTEIGQLAKAWVNFNGTGTVAIRSSFNVASVTDNGTGNYTVNFTNAMSDGNYCCQVSSGNDATQGQGAWNTVYDDSTTLAGSTRLAFYSNIGDARDTEQAFFTVFEN